MPNLPSTTLEHLETHRQDVLGCWSRRTFLVALTLVLVLGLAGFLGVRVASTSDTADGWSLRLEYAATARAGLDVPWTVTVNHDGGFDKQITLALTGDYFDIYETQGFNPDADSATRDGDTLYLTFAAPPSGDTFVVRYDAYIQPAAQVGKHATLSVLSDGTAAATVEFTTHLLP